MKLKAGEMMPARMLHSEQTALAALQLRLPEKFATAQLLDRPDIQDTIADVGVEVTDGLRADLRRLLANQQTASKHKRRALARMGITGRFHLGHQPATRALASAALNDVPAAIHRKNQKFKQYRHFSENDLFIHVMPDARNEVPAALAALKRTPYDFVFLFDGHVLVVIDCASGTVSRA